MAPGTIIPPGIHMLVMDINKFAVTAVVSPEAMAVIAEI
jgi:hypothetical protein